MNAADAAMAGDFSACRVAMAQHIATLEAAGKLDALPAEWTGTCW